ncbi:MAG: hypothetical protein VZQ81_06400 [Succiniclasticum sp.]|jgi:hypothetical protein|nr:hypothetical protein [Succiniclasticum sp.]MEE3479634.1 hypothetical protein [Succiniclasticum sp.]
MKRGIPAWLKPLQRMYEDRVGSRMGPESRKALVLLAVVLVAALVQVRVVTPLAAETDRLAAETAGREREIRLYGQFTGRKERDGSGLSRHQREELETLRRRLPDRVDGGNLMAALSAEAARQGIRLSLLRQKQPGPVRGQDGMQYLELELEGTAPFADWLRFLEAIEETGGCRRFRGGNLRAARPGHLMFQARLRAYMASPGKQTGPADKGESHHAGSR